MPHERQHEQQQDGRRGLAAHAENSPERLVDQAEKREERAEPRTCQGRVRHESPVEHEQKNEAYPVRGDVLDLEQHQGRGRRNQAIGTYNAAEIGVPQNAIPPCGGAASIGEPGM